MERADLVYRMAFASVRGMNRALADDLIARLGSEREFFEASETRLRYITSSRSRIYTADYRAARLRDAEAEERLLRLTASRPSIIPMRSIRSVWPTAMTHL